MTEVPTHAPPKDSTAADKNAANRIGDYVVRKPLGRGSFSRVFLGSHFLTGKEVALKVIDHKMLFTNDRELEKINREIKIMKKLNHPHIVRLNEVIQLPEKKATCLVLEYMKGGELFNYIVAKKRLPEQEACRLFLQMLSAVEYCHSNLVIHRDLKPENILMDGEGNIKINDFGLSNVMKLGLFLETSCGSPLYSPPEIISGSTYIGPEVDIWAMGVIIYAMVCGYLPWEGRDVNEQIEHVVRGNYKTPSWVSESCKNLMSRMIVVDSKKRATLAEVRNHPWLQTYNPGTPLVNPTSSLPSGSTPSQPSRGPKKITADQIDEEILQKLQQLGYDPTEVTKNLLENNTLSQSYFLYSLMLREKIKQKEQQQKTEQMERPASPVTGGPPKSPRGTPASSSPTRSKPSLRLSVTPSPFEEGSSTHRPITPDKLETQVDRLQAQTRNRRHTWGGLEDGVVPPISSPGRLPVPELPPVSPHSPKERSGIKGSIFNILRKKKKEEVDESLANEFQNGLVLRAVHKNRKSAEDIVAEVESALKRLKIEYDETKKGRKLRCTIEGAVFNIDIRTSEKLESIREVKFNPISGSTVSHFKEIYQNLSNEIKI